jgi:hypothetical protein
MLVDARVERTEERQHLFPHTYAEVTPVRIGRIASVAKRTALGVGLDLGAVRSNQWTKEILGRGREHGKPLNGSAAEDSDQNGLGAILEVMPRRDESRRNPRGKVSQRGVASVAGAGLEVSSALDDKLDLVKRDAAGARELLGQCELQRRFRTQPVIDPARMQRDPRGRVRALSACGARHVREDIEQHLRVDASRTRHHDRAAIRDLRFVECLARERRE